MSKFVDIEKALVQADPKLGKLIKAVVSKSGKIQHAPSDHTPFEALARAIIYQQLATKAAAAIHKKFMTLIKGRLTPQKVLALSHGQMRSAGLSNSKAAYLHNLAQWFVDNHKTAKRFSDMNDEEIIEALVSIKGIGVWTANMFLMFNLARPDVVPVGDLGIQRGVQLLYKMKDRATPRQVHKRALNWQPYRTVASMYLWQSLRLGLTPADFI